MLICNLILTFADKSRIETYNDSGDYREVNVRVWYPKEETKGCPLVIFSHGTNGINITNVSLFRELASHGYVVCSLDHPYHSFFTKDEAGKITLISQKYQQQYFDGVQTEDKEKTAAYLKEWMEIREGDINCVINQIMEKTKDIGLQEWCQKIDPAKIAVCGHSMGGSAALGIGRHRKDISAVIALESPYMSDILGVEKKQNQFIWEEEPYPVPVLNIYSDCTWGQFHESPLYEENEKALHGEAGKVRNVHIGQTGHMGLTDLSLVSPILANILDSQSGKMTPASSQENVEGVLKCISQESLTFLDYYLKGEGKEPDMQ